MQFPRLLRSSILIVGLKTLVYYLYALIDKPFRKKWLQLQKRTLHDLYDRAPTLALPFVSFESLYRSTTIHIPHPRTDEGTISPIEMIYLATILKQTKPKKVVEIGTFKGQTTALLAQNTPRDCEIFTIDLPQDSVNNTSLRLHPWDEQFVSIDAKGRYAKSFEKVSFISGDSASNNTYNGVSGAEFIFIDGSHAYEYVVNDSLRAREIAADKAIIIWHDYNTSWYEVTYALDYLFAKDATFKSLKAIEGTSLAYLSYEKSSQ